MPGSGCGPCCCGAPCGGCACEPINLDYTLARMYGFDTSTKSSLLVLWQQFLRHLGQGKIFLVFRGKNRIGNIPVDLQLRIAPQHPIFMFGIIEVAALVEKLCSFRQDEKAMGKTL